MTQSTDMTHAEAQQAFLAFATSISKSADVSAGLNVSRYSSKTDTLSCTIWPKGLSSGQTFGAEAATWEELLAAVKETWAEREATYNADTIRDMALAVIRITHEVGECTDRALRVDFSTQDVERFADRAAALASEMAAGGPFTVITTDGANAPVAA